MDYKIIVVGFSSKGIVQYKTSQANAEITECTAGWHHHGLP